MEISNSSAWGVLILVGVLSGLVGYSFANKAAQSPPRANSLDSIVKQTKAEYEALTPPLERTTEKMLADMNAAGNERGEKFQREFSSNNSHERRETGMVIEKILAKQVALNFKTVSVEITRSGSAYYPFHAIWILEMTKSVRKSAPQEIVTPVDKFEELPLELTLDYVERFGILLDLGGSRGDTPRFNKPFEIACAECLKAPFEPLETKRKTILLRFSAETKEWEWDSDAPNPNGPQ